MPPKDNYYRKDMADWARYLGLESIYLSPLLKRGVRIPEGIEETALTTTRVRDIMREEAVWISETATFDMIVVDEATAFKGLVLSHVFD